MLIEKPTSKYSEVASRWLERFLKNPYDAAFDLWSLFLLGNREERMSIPRIVTSLGQMANMLALSITKFLIKIPSEWGVEEDEVGQVIPSLVIASTEISFESVPLPLRNELEACLKQFYAPGVGENELAIRPWYLAELIANVKGSDANWLIPDIRIWLTSPNDHLTGHLVEDPLSKRTSAARVAGLIGPVAISLKPLLLNLRRDENLKTRVMGYWSIYQMDPNFRFDGKINELRSALTDCEKLLNEEGLGFDSLHMSCVETLGSLKATFTVLGFKKQTLLPSTVKRLEEYTKAPWVKLMELSERTLEIWT